MSRKLSRLTALLLTILGFSNPIWAEFGDKCPALTLSQPLQAVRTRLETMVPLKSWVLASETCVAGLHAVVANYSSLCELTPTASVFMAVALGRPSASELSLLAFYLPYSSGAVAELRSKIVAEGGRRVDSTPAFLEQHLANAQEAELYGLGVEASLLLLTKERGLAALNDRDVTVVRLFASHGIESSLNQLRVCASR